MLMMLIALTLLSSAPSCKSEANDQETSGIGVGYSLRKAPPPFPYSLNPQWQVVVLASQNGGTPTQSSESNLEHWRNLIQAEQYEDSAPKQAVQRPREYRFRTGYNMGPHYRSHSPWLTPVQRYLPQFEEVGKVLYYDLVAVPSIRKPYYEGIVSVMPTIRCRAKTIELLQEQLLQQYSQYLAKMLQDEEDFPHQQQNNRPEQQGLNGAFIAWLVGATSEEKQLDSSQKGKVTIERSCFDKVPAHFPPYFDGGWYQGIDFVF